MLVSNCSLKKRDELEKTGILELGLLSYQKSETLVAHDRNKQKFEAEYLTDTYSAAIAAQ